MLQCFFIVGVSGEIVGLALADRHVQKCAPLLRPVLHKPQMIGSEKHGTEASDHFGCSIYLVSVFHSFFFCSEDRVRKRFSAELRFKLDLCAKALAAEANEIALPCLSEGFSPREEVNTLDRVGLSLRVASEQKVHSIVKVDFDVFNVAKILRTKAF